jgi:hypothetical protein
MAIQDDVTIDYANRRITYTTAFVDDRPPSIYPMNELYSWLQDTFDEPAQMNQPTPMTAQTPTQYTIGYPWFTDNETLKAFYGGSLQSSGWTKSGSDGITALRYQDSPTTAPDSGDIGETFTGGTSGATGVCLAVDTTRQIVWVRNTSAAQFQGNENVTGPASDPDFQTETTNGFQTGDSVWTCIFSTGPIRPATEVFVGQEPDQLGGTAYHDSDADSRYERRLEKLAEWWDADQDFSGTPNGIGAQAEHIDLIILTKELGVEIDGQRLVVCARQAGQTFSHFEIIGGLVPSVIPFSANAEDKNNQDGPYLIGFDNRSGTTLAVGDILENDTGTPPVGRLRAVVTAVTGGAAASGTIDFYLIGDTEADGTLIQLADDEDMAVRGSSTCTFDIDTVGQALTAQNGAVAGGVTVTFADAQVDVDEDATDEEYACTINCNNVPLADVYQRVMFLCCRGNQNGTTPGTPDTLLPSGHASLGEGSEFYRAVGDIVFDYDNRTGTPPVEGDLVKGSISGAYGVVTSITAAATGVCVLTQVKGEFEDGDQVAEIDAAGGNYVEVNGAPESIADNTAAPFGTFAGGRWFVAQGVVLDNVPAADANNWETIDLAGVTRAPPTSRAITFAGLEINDRATIMEVDTAGGIDITENQNGVGATGAAVGATQIPLDSIVALDVPPSGYIRVVDTSLASTGVQYRYEYATVIGTTVTLRTGSGLTGTCTAGGTSTVLNDTGAFTNFGTDGNCKVGHEIRNVASGGIAIVVRKIDNNSIETTVLSSGTWSDTNNWEANRIVVNLVDADTVYFPFIDGVVASGSSLSSTIKFVGVTECVARARFSSPDISSDRIEPFELKNVQVTDADLTVTAIRNEDTIAS